MLRRVLAMLVASFSTVASADVLFTQAPTTSGALLMSSYWNPDGSDYDEYVWDSFVLPAAADITEIQWRGGGAATVMDFRIEIWASIPAGIQPDIGNMNGGRLARFTAGGNANQTLVGSVGGTTMYDYRYTLRTPFRAVAGVKYWVQIEAWTVSFPFWGLATGSGGNGTHFHRAAGAGDARYFYLTGDAAFTLIGNPVTCTNPTITLQPTSVQYCNTGGTVTFATAATGAGPMSYRWRLNGSPVYDGPNGGGHGGGAFVSGATTPTLSITAPSHWADVGNYDCVVTNSCGSSSSDSAALAFSTVPYISGQPFDVSTCRGGAASFGVTVAVQGGASYQWMLDGAPIVDGTTWSGSVISGSQSDMLTIDNAQLADVGSYSCVVSNECAPGGVTSAIAMLSICAADFNCDATVDFFDYLDFVAAFSGGAPASDFNADGVTDFFDYLDFVAAFSGGC